VTGDLVSFRFRQATGLVITDCFLAKHAKGFADVTLGHAVATNVDDGFGVSALDHARAVCTLLGAWTSEDTLEQRRDDIDVIIGTTLGAPEIATWQEFIAHLPPAMNLEELRDYVWMDNAQQRNDVLRAVAVRLRVDPDDVPPQLDRVRVMTMHGAKGLSGRVVFIPGLEQGFLPTSTRRRSSRCDWKRRGCSTCRSRAPGRHA